MSPKEYRILTDPELSDDAKALFLMLYVNAGRLLADDGGATEIPEHHWWTDRTTESMFVELANLGVYEPVL